MDDLIGRLHRELKAADLHCEDAATVSVALLREAAAALEAAREDGDRWRHARKLLSIDDIEGAQGAYELFGRLISEDECKRADAAIDAARAAQQPAAVDEVDDSLTAAYMAGRHDGKKSAQQPADDAHPPSAPVGAAEDMVLDAIERCESSAPVGVEGLDTAVWNEVLELPDGFRVAEHLPGIWEYQFDIEDEADEDSDRKVSGTSWNHPALAAIAAWSHAYDALAQQHVAAAMRKVAAVAHSGGLIGLNPYDALTAIRRLSLPYWGKEEKPEQVHAALASQQGGSNDD